MGLVAHRHAASSAIATGVEFGITLIRSDTGTLSKHYSMDAGGHIEKTPSVGLWRGTARTVRFTPIAFARAIEQLDPREAISNGVLCGESAQAVQLLTKAALKRPNAPIGSIARTKKYFEYRAEPGLLLLDVDLKGATPEVWKRIQASGGVWPLMCQLEPKLCGALRIERASTSTGIYRGDTSQRVGTNLGGMHIFVLIDDMTDAQRITNLLADRLIEDGLGWTLTSSDGKLLSRCPVDRQVASPERLIYESSPVLGPGLRQDERQAVLHDGGSLDTRVLWPPADTRAPRLARSRECNMTRASSRNGEVQDSRPRKVSTKREITLWASRQAFLLAVMNGRGGATLGQRNTFFWLLANAIAWLTTDEETYFCGVKCAFEAHFAASWTWGEALNSASAITSLVGGCFEPYRMTDAKLIDKIEASPDELLAHSYLLRARSARNDGVMQLPPIGGLARPDWERTVLAYQRAGGRYTAENRSSRQAHSNVVRKAVFDGLQAGANVASLAAVHKVDGSTIRRWRATLRAQMACYQTLEQEAAAEVAAHSIEQTAQKSRVAAFLSRRASS